MARQIGQGKSEQEAIAARPLADLHARAGASEQASGNFARTVYHSLKSKNPG